MVGALYDQKWRNIPTVATNAGDRSCPFPIARLYTLISSASIGPSDDHARADLAHHKAGLVEIVKVAVEDAIFSSHISY